mmetsp:Transcript_124549/g.398716  ORF Transcript_124549/g.398716 Transcript_124549/m.398716 type:complete len:493 (+) Transcript_124549:3173-4651(+)
MLLGCELLPDRHDRVQRRGSYVSARRRRRGAGRRPALLGLLPLRPGRGRRKLCGRGLRGHVAIPGGLLARLRCARRLVGRRGLGGRRAGAAAGPRDRLLPLVAAPGPRAAAGQRGAGGRGAQRGTEARAGASWFGSRRRLPHRKRGRGHTAYRASLRVGRGHGVVGEPTADLGADGVQRVAPCALPGPEGQHPVPELVHEHRPARGLRSRAWHYGQPLLGASAAGHCAALRRLRVAFAVSGASHLVGAPVGERALAVAACLARADCVVVAGGDLGDADREAGCVANRPLAGRLGHRRPPARRDAAHRRRAPPGDCAGALHAGRVARRRLHQAPLLDRCGGAPPGGLRGLRQCFRERQVCGAGRAAKHVRGLLVQVPGAIGRGDLDDVLGAPRPFRLPAAVRRGHQDPKRLGCTELGRRHRSRRPPGGQRTALRGQPPLVRGRAHEGRHANLQLVHVGDLLPLRRGVAAESCRHRPPGPVLTSTPGGASAPPR